MTGTMTLANAAEIEGMTVADLAREAYEGRLTLHRLPSCPECPANEGSPCRPGCGKAASQIVWIGDWLRWRSERDERETG